MLIRINSFTGEVPRLQPSQLPDGAAQEALDCDFSRGTLQGAKNPDPVAGISGSGIKSFFVFEGGAAAGNRFWWNRDVDAVRSPIVDDAYARFYWTDDSGFYVSRGDLGGNGEPSSSNRYKVGVPKPVAALIKQGGEFSFPGVTAIEFTLCDEAADGSMSNCVTVTPAVTKSVTSVTYTFTARAPQSADGAATVETKPAAVEVTGSWSLEGTLYAGATPLRAYSSGLNKVVFYDDPLGLLPASIWVSNYVDGMHRSGEDLFLGQFFRLGDTSWYGSHPSIVPPTQTGPTTPLKTETTVEQPFKGAALKMMLIRADGTQLEVVLRDGGSTFPPELPGYIGSLTNDSGTGWSASVGAAENYVENRAYTYTYVNQFGEEGPPADPLEVDCAEGASVTVKYAAPPSGFCPISRVRLYRTATGTTTNYLFVGEAVIGGAATITDDVRNESLGEPLSTTWHYPPDQALRGICVMANGIVVGFKDNEVHFMEPYLPYACNPTAIKPFPHRVVGICPFEGGLYVTTTAHPYIIMGAEPMSMTDAKIPAIQAGVSKGGIVNIGGQVAYASHDGIVLAQGMAASLDLSFKFFTRNEWRERFGAKLYQMRLSAHDGSLLVWFDDGTPGFVLRFEEEAVSLSRITDQIHAAFVNPEDDSLYVSDGTGISAFRAGGGRKPFVWHSKDFAAPAPVNFGALQLIGSGTASIEVRADGVLRYSRAGVVLANTGSTMLRLPAGFLARNWSLRISGAAEVLEALLASSVGELRNV